MQSVFAQIERLASCGMVAGSIPATLLLIFKSEDHSRYELARSSSKDLLMALFNWSRVTLGSTQGRRSHVEINNSPRLAGYCFIELCSIFPYSPIFGSPDEPSLYG